jgi:hypothetical protein
VVKEAIGLALLLTAGSAVWAEGPVCRPAGPEDRTIGGHIPSSFRVKGSLKAVQGVVVDPTGAPIEGVLVELFDHPEQSSWYLLVPQDGVQRRIAACWTGPDGRYQFGGIVAGHYDLRAGAHGFNAAFHWVFVDPKGKGRRHFRIRLELGT